MDEEIRFCGACPCEAARELGMQTVPCLRISTLSEAEKRAYILADNKLAQNAGWNEDLLAGELEYLLTQGEEIDIELTGFSIAEVDQLLDVGGTDQSAESNEDDQIPEVRAMPSRALVTFGPSGAPGSFAATPARNKPICG